MSWFDLHASSCPGLSCLCQCVYMSWFVLYSSNSSLTSWSGMFLHTLYIVSYTSFIHEALLVRLYTVVYCIVCTLNPSAVLLVVTCVHYGDSTQCIHCVHCLQPRAGRSKTAAG